MARLRHVNAGASLYAAAEKGIQPRRIKRGEIIQGGCAHYHFTIVIRADANGISWLVLSWSVDLNKAKKQTLW